MTFIKFCGMTREADVAFAAALGVDALGFVLWQGSPRHVTFARLDDLLRGVPDTVTPVAVFVRPTSDDVARALSAGIRVAQIHGGAPAAPVDCECWLATSFSAEDGATAHADGDTLLLDAHDSERHGGTGRTIDWERAAQVAARRRVILAGGLTPENVGNAIRTVRPYGVDVASGIEREPGIKDRGAMERFVLAVREADR
jgi:phosphoribosylanthranilate isomerase